jgi:tetratricopeptide (TPR) repeat protein
VAYGAAFAGLIALLVTSPSFRLWLGGAIEAGPRLFPRHLPPLRLQADALLSSPPEWPPHDLDAALRVYRGALDRLRKLEAAGLLSPDLEELRGRLELGLARELIDAGRAHLAAWHVLEASRRLRRTEDLLGVARLAQAQSLRRALAIALLRAGDRLGAWDPFFPTDLPGRAELHDWLGRELAATGRLHEAERHWRECAALGRPRCHSSLAALALRAADRRTALAHHREALALDPNHWPSLLALEAQEESP